MGVNTKIHLPLHVRSNHVLQVLGKLVGEPWELINDGSPDKDNLIDAGKPASKHNDWRIRFSNLSRTLKVSATDTCASLGTMQFTDASGQSHQWYWHTESEEEDWKTLSPGSHALAVAVGRRLVQFFGGQVCYADTTDNVDYEISNEKARFPRKDPAQDVNDRWYQFQNTLVTEPLLTRQELRDAMKHVGTDGRYDDLQKALDTMGAENLKDHMDRAIPVTAANSTPSRKPGGRF